MTGLTSLVAENDNVTLEQFAMRCARYFGALVDMRDLPFDAPVPEKFEPSDYCRKRFEKAKAAYESFIANPPTYEDLERQYNDYVAKETSLAEKEKEHRKVIRQRYESMLARVMNWQPPTSEHEGLKTFMIDQLKNSIEWDCREYKPHISDKESYIMCQASDESLKKDIDYWAKEWGKEIKRVNERNKWVADLRESLKESDVQP